MMSKVAKAFGSLLIVLIGMLFVLYVFVILTLEPCYLCLRIRKKRRLISRRKLMKRIQADDAGTLLFQPYRRKIIRGIWWTADDVIGLSPVEVPCLPRGANDCRAPTPFDDWCNAQYLSEEFGAAVLVAGSAEGI